MAIEVVNSAEFDEDMKFFARETASKGEVGGLFRVVPLDGVLVIDKYDIIKQKSKTAGMLVSLDPEAIEAWVEEHVEMQYPEEGGMPVAHWGWFHHHCSAGVTPSGTDREFIDDHAMRGWFVTLIFNDEGKVHCEVATFAGGKTKRESSLLTVNASYRVEKPEFARAKEMRAKIKEHVEWVSPVQTSHQSKWKERETSRYGSQWWNEQYGGEKYGESDFSTPSAICTKHEESWYRCKCGSETRVTKEQWEAHLKASKKQRGHKKPRVEVTIYFPKRANGEKRDFPYAYSLGEEGPKIFVRDIPVSMQVKLGVRGVRWGEVKESMKETGGQIRVTKKGATMCFSEEVR